MTATYSHPPHPSTSKLPKAQASASAEGEAEERDPHKLPSFELNEHKVPRKRVPDAAPPPPRKKGRPRKTVVEPAKMAVLPLVSIPRKRGRPRKIKVSKDSPMQESLEVLQSNLVTRIDLYTEPQSFPSSSINASQAFVFSPSYTSSILSDITSFAINPPPSSTTPSRSLLHSAYGGSPFISVQYTFPSRNPSGQDTQRMFIFPKHELDPSMPYLPGQPGIVIDNRYLRNKVPQPWSLFRKVSGAKGLSTTWLYLGEYEFVYKGKMSTEVFSAQNDAVKQNWAEGLLGQKHSLNDTHFSMLARITLRKAGSLPCRDQSKEDALVEKEKDKILAGKASYPVSTDDIVDAFARGDEAIDITALKCVAYDRVLADDIEAKCASFNGYTVPEFMIKRNPKQGASKNAPVTVKGSGKTKTTTTISLADMFTNPLPPSSREGDGAMGFGSGAWLDSLDGQGSEGDVDYHRMGESSKDGDGDGEAGEELGWDDGDGEYMSEDGGSELSYP
ncbi:hypothetical protein NMY22_g2078 [Coprinellus aureogranulatus]|nr:hypothetical protein NMY22_g2078 [Coprinellus aureogranulatus]